jgi:hypothetical protein
MMDAVAAAVASHEAAHASAALLLGRRLLYVKREGSMCGETVSFRQDGSVALSALIALIVPVYVAPIPLATIDLSVAEWLGEIGADVGAAHQGAQELVRRPDFHAAFRTIEYALWSQPMLTGEECALLVASEEGTPWDTTKR